MKKKRMLAILCAAAMTVNGMLPYAAGASETDMVLTDLSEEDAYEIVPEDAGPEEPGQDEEPGEKSSEMIPLIEDPGLTAEDPERDGIDTLPFTEETESETERTDFLPGTETGEETEKEAEETEAEEVPEETQAEIAEAETEAVEEEMTVEDDAAAIEEMTEEVSLQAAGDDPLEGAELQITDADPNTAGPISRLDSGLDFGTIDLSEGPYIIEKRLWYQNVSSVDPDTWEPFSISIDQCFVESISEADKGSTAFSGGPMSSWNGGYSYKLEGGEAADDCVTLDATDLMAGTYIAYYHVPVEPAAVRANGGALKNDPETGDILIPLRVKLTGYNPYLPARIRNVKAEPGNNCITVSWDALDDFGIGKQSGVYYIFRRDGAEPGIDPGYYDYSQYEMIKTIKSGNGENYSTGYSAEDGVTSFTDYSAENGKVYSYFVIGTEEPDHGYPSEAAIAEPSDQLTMRLKGPEISAGGVKGGVSLQWNLAEDELYPDYPEGYAPGTDVVDHFNVYQNGNLIAQVDQASCTKRAWEDKYEWELTIPCEDLSADNRQISYTWWVTAVSAEALGGTEGYASAKVDQAPMQEYPMIISYSAIWDGIEEVTLRANADNCMRTLEVWRDGECLGDSIHNEGNAGYFNGGIEFYDRTAKKGSTYTYTMYAVNWDGQKSAPVTIKVNTSSSNGWYTESPDVRYQYFWYVANGDTPTLKFYVYDDEVFRVMRNGQVSAVYGSGGIASGDIVYRDRPVENGTYVYQIIKEADGVTTVSPECVYTKEAQSEEIMKAPEAPKLSARLVGEEGHKNVLLTWKNAAAGAEADGVYIYRTDGGAVNTDAFADADGQEEYRAANNNRSEPALGRYFRRYAPLNSYTDQRIFWEDEDGYPHQYWVCAYNQYGISEPSNIITYLDEDGNGVPDDPGYLDTEAPGTPVITDVSLQYDPESYGAGGRADNYRVQVNTAWKASELGGATDYFLIYYEKEQADKTWEVDYYSSSPLYPALSDAEDGLMTSNNNYRYPNAYGKHRVRVVAGNQVGETETIREFYLGGIPDLSVKAVETPDGKPGAAAELRWTGLYQDDAEVSGFEIWRRSPYSLWKKLSAQQSEFTYAPETGTWSYTDTGLSDRETYHYYVVAKTDSAPEERKSVERKVRVYEGYQAPAAPVLLEPVLTGYTGGPYLMLNWSAPSAGIPTAYYMQVKKTLNNLEGEWEEWYPASSGGEREALLGDEKKQEEILDQTYKLWYAYWHPTPAKFDSISFRIQAVNSAGASPWSNAVTVNVQEAMDNYSPEEESPWYVVPQAQAGDGMVTLTWNRTIPSGYVPPVYYTITRYPVTARQGDTPTDWQTTYYYYGRETELAVMPAEKESYTFTDHDLDNGQMYAYEVKAFNAAGDSYDWGYSKPLDRIIVSLADQGKTADEKVVGQIEDLITELPEPEMFNVSDEDDLAALNEVTALFNALTKEQQEAVSDDLRGKLTALRQKVKDAEGEALAEQLSEKIGAVQALIDALPSTVPADILLPGNEDDLSELTQKIDAARDAYNALPEAAAKKVETEKLSLLENSLLALYQDAADQAAVQRVIGMIDTLPAAADITAENIGEIRIRANNVRRSYEVLTPRQKKMLSDSADGTEALGRLEAAENKIKALEEEEAERIRREQEPLQAVIDRVTELGDVAGIRLEDKDAVLDAWSAYQDLDEQLKELIPEKLAQILQQMKTRIDQLVQEKADQDAADPVIALIREIPDLEQVNLSNAYDRNLYKQKVDAADAAYGNLTPAQQDLVSNAGDLTKAKEYSIKMQTEAGRAELQEAIDRAAAQRVAVMIRQLPFMMDITAENAPAVAPAVSAARTEYNKLSAKQKTYIPEDLTIKLEVLESVLEQMGVNGGGNGGGNGGNGGNNGGGNNGGGNNQGGNPGAGGGGAAPAPSLPVGMTQVVGTGLQQASYTVTAPNEVTLVKCMAPKKAKSLTAPDTVVINGVTCRVTAVAPGAFSGYKKAKKAVIGINVRSIGAKAFNKCKSLKTLTVRSTQLTAAGCKKCLKGSGVKTVKVPKPVKKQYKKIFVKKVCGVKAKVK